MPAGMPARDKDRRQPHGWILHAVSVFIRKPTVCVYMCARVVDGQDVLAGAGVDEVGEEDADGDVELEQDVEPAADPRRRDLGQEQGNGLQVVFLS